MQLARGPEISEVEIVRLWQERVQTQAAFEDDRGESLRLVYPGRPNDGRGGDFRDAVISSSRGCQKGCIEIHRLTSGWESHGHHRDPHYNQVILQVAWKADRCLPARLEDGRSIPTVILEKLLTPAANNLAEHSLICREYCRKTPSEQINSVLEEAGEQRFRQKSRSFQSRLARNEGPQILYEGLSEALGYSRNQKAFASFSQRVPLSVFSLSNNE
ncbi:MAG TPA: DUF2851 family protein, partial [Dehalococcoidales bacterium]|nr:DUF2851 family protein [Dehalococcoidales bacterium]